MTKLIVCNHHKPDEATKKNVILRTNILNMMKRA